MFVPVLVFAVLVDRLLLAEAVGAVHGMGRGQHVVVRAVAASTSNTRPAGEAEGGKEGRNDANLSSARKEAKVTT